MHVTIACKGLFSLRNINFAMFLSCEAGNGLKPAGAVTVVTLLTGCICAFRRESPFACYSKACPASITTKY